MNNHIKNALLHGRLVLLLGAGASIGCQNQEKTSPPLGNKLAEILSNAIDITKSEEDSLSDVYKASQGILGSQLQEILERQFKHCRSSEEYKKLVNYPFTRIYSLNIDDGFEDAAYRHSDRTFNIKQRNDKVTDPDQFFQRLDFIKLNGDISQPNGGYIFSSQEYSAGSVNEPLWYAELARDYHRYTFLFIGTNLNEPLFQHQIEKYKSKTESTDLKSYLLTPSISEIKKSALQSANIFHIQGTLKDFLSWLEKEFENPPTSKDILKNVRPELVDSDSVSEDKKVSLFEGVIPVSRSSLALIEEPPHANEIRDFYKGFKPSWKDITDEVPANLTKVEKFYNENFVTKTPSPGDLYFIFGAAGCGKSTALKQIALKLADNGTQNVYFLDEYKDNFRELISELDDRNKDPYYLVIERIGDIAVNLSEILKSGISNKAIFVSSESVKVWNFRVKDHLAEFMTQSVDITEIIEPDAELILRKLERYGIWTTMSKLSPKKRKIEILKKAKKQLLIGLLEATQAEGYNNIIKKDYNSITCDSERSLLILSGLAATNRVSAHETTLTRAMHTLGMNPNIHYIASNMGGIVKYINGNVSTRHRVYIERLFKYYVPRNELVTAIKAYLLAFSVYKFPIVKNISRTEGSIYKHLVNAKYLKKILNNDEESVLSVYAHFEKTFENEGLFLLQYGLALRSFDRNNEAFEKLRIAYQAYPESPHIEHALAQQRIILACQEEDETIAFAHMEEAESVLLRLHSSNLNTFDRYPIITLSEGHVQVLVHLGYISEAQVIAKSYHDKISKIPNANHSSRLQKSLKNLSKFYISKKWPAQELEELTF